MMFEINCWTWETRSLVVF